MSVARFKIWSLVACATWLVACSSTIQRPKPVEITSVEALQEVRQTWTARLQEVKFSLIPHVAAGRIAFADSQGNVSVVDAQTGKDIWRVWAATTNRSLWSLAAMSLWCFAMVKCSGDKA